MSPTPKNQALRLALGYALVAGGWILLSDRILGALVQDPATLTRISIYKGCTFVLVTAVLLYLTLRRLISNWAGAAERLARAEQTEHAAKEKLRQQEEQLRLITETSLDGYWDWDLKNDLAYLSQTYWELTGYPAEATLANMEVLKKMVLPEDWPAVSARLEQHFAGNTATVISEHRLVTRDGAVKWVCVRGKIVERAPGGQPLRMVGSITNITDRKAAEQKIRESEEQYRQLFELESDAVVLVDCQTHRYLDCNASAERLYGYTREEMLRMTVEQISAEPEKTRESIGKGRVFIPLRWHRNKQGDRLALEITSSTIQHRGRTAELAALRDVTARQKVNEELERTAEQLLEAQRIARAGSYHFDFAADRWTGSKVLDELFGITTPDFIRNAAGWLEIVHPKDREEIRPFFQDRPARGQKSFDRTFRIVRLGDGTERWVHGLGRFVSDDQGRPTEMVGVVQDITDYKRAEEQLNVHLSALAAAANAIVITNRDGRIEWVNPAFTQLTGYSKSEAIGRKPSILKSGQNPPELYTALWATITAGNVWHGQLINRHKGGKLYTEEMTITPVRGIDGLVTHFVAIKLDVTQRQLLEKHLQQAHKMEAIGTLAGGIAHDFNNILGAMSGYGFLLQQENKGNPEAQDNVAEILKAIDRARDLVQQILTFSRQRERKAEHIQLNTVIKEAIRFLRASLPANIKIELDLDAQAPAVLADPTQIYQVAINLATNALHAMEGQPGRLAVRLKPFAPDPLFLETHPELKPIPYTRLSVADTGHGMDAQTLERIFEPFFTTKPVGKGTGLGLAVVHGIVQSHGGVITVESQVDIGTTFDLYFPAQTQEADAAPAHTASMPPGQGERILLVDDEASLTKVLCRILTKLNYAVTAHNSPREAFGLFDQDPDQFDLIITDFSMPEFSGLDLARQIHIRRPGLPIILVSGFTADMPPEKSSASGVDEVLDKPVSMTRLADALRRLLDGRPPSRDHSKPL